MINPKILVQVKDESAVGACVTHHRVNEMEVCAPATWNSAAVIALAEFKQRCISGHRWEVMRNSETCSFEPGFAHYQLHAVNLDQPTIRVVHERDATPTQPSDTLHVNTIINITGAVTAEELDRSAESFALLTLWLRTKALAVEARNAEKLALAIEYDREAESLNSRLLAQFRGALVLI